MISGSKMELKKPDVMAAIEFWLNAKTFKEPVAVLDVKQQNYSPNDFEVEVARKPEAQSHTLVEMCEGLRVTELRNT